MPVRPTYFMRTLAHLRTSAIAVATILAMLFVPACGPLCAAMNHCSSSAASANSDSCHHASMSTQLDSETLSFSSQASCGQQSPLVAILTSSESSLQPLSTNTAIAASGNLPNRTITPASRPHDFLPSKESPQNSIPLENLSILRI
jgi:hypothetical protein